jgi:hypothetical protein
MPSALPSAKTGESLAYFCEHALFGFGTAIAKVRPIRSGFWGIVTSGMNDSTILVAGTELFLGLSPGDYSQNRLASFADDFALCAIWL